jgi:hypothetical protein
MLLRALLEPIVQRYCVLECVGAVVLCVRWVLDIEGNVNFPSALEGLIAVLVAGHPMNAARIETCDLTVMCTSLSLDLSTPSVLLQKVLSSAIIKGRLLQSEEDSEAEKVVKLCHVNVLGDFDRDDNSAKELAALVQEVVRCIRKDRYYIVQTCECLRSFFALLHCMLLAEGISFPKMLGDIIVENVTSVRKDIVNMQAGLRSEVKQAKILEDMIRCLSEIDFVWSNMKSKLLKREDLFF